MPDPTTLLPREIFNQVLCLVELEPHWRRLSLVSQRWHSLMIPHLYRSWAYDGVYDDYYTLWHFLQRMLRNPHLAVLVQTIQIGNWGVNLSSLLHQDFRSPFDDGQDLDLVHQAINHAHLDHLKPQIMQGLRQGDRRPLMALLLAHLSQLRTIHAHVPPVDPFLSAILQQALDDQGKVLQNLQNLYLFGEVSLSRDPPQEGGVPLRLNHIWPVLYLKSLRRLSIYDLEIEGFANLLQQHDDGHQRCYIQHLTLKTHNTSSCRAADIRALLHLPESLSSLLLYIHDGTVQTMPRPSKISNTDIRTAINKHHRSLQYLDIYRAGWRDISSPHPHGSLGSMQSFPCLQHLGIELQDIITDSQERTTTRLRDALPQALSSLVLYSCLGVPDAIMQIQEVMTEYICPGLHSLIIQDSNLHRQAGQEVNNDIFRQILQDNGVHLQLKMVCSHTINPRAQGCDMAQGGLCPALWGLQTCNMRTTGQQRRLDTMQKLLPETNAYDSDTLSETASPFFFDGYYRHFIAFTDHTGKTGYMYFKNYDTCPLPPLFSFAIYFTCPDTVPEEIKVNMKGLFDALTERDSQFQPRLDIYFLPGADEHSCIAHYRGELAVRGSYKEQIRAYREYRHRGIARPPPPPGKLPGMVMNYHDSTRGVLFMCSEKGGQDELEALWRVDFAINGEAPADQEKEDTSVDKELWPIADEHPLADELGTSIEGWVLNAHYWADMRKWDKIWKNASKRGWKNWW